MTSLIKLIGKWVTIPTKDLREGKLNDYVHFEDISMIGKLEQPVVEIIGVENGYIRIKSGDFIYRVEPVLIREAKNRNFL